MRRFAVITCVTLLLSACSGMQTHTEIEALNEAKAIGSPFTQKLAKEYKDMANSRQRWLDYSDARHFAKKGLMAAEGKPVLPELLSNWHLDENSLTMLRDKRNKLMAMLDGGGRVQAPFEAAIAQARFDCMVEQQEQYWISPAPAPCRKQFDDALLDLEARMNGALPSSIKADEPLPVKKVEEAPAPVEPVVDPSAMRSGMDEGMFLVFFDFDRKDLTDSGHSVIDAIAKQAKARPDLHAISVTGHADTSGPAAYNQKLSIARAEAVKQALAAKGINGMQIKIQGRGENELMLQTPNNTREPANRRAEIRFE